MIPVKSIGNTNDYVGEVRIPVVNRTGGTLTVGGIYRLDIAQADAASTTAEKGLSNILATSTATLAYPAVVATEAVADDAQTTVILAGICNAYVNGSVAKGDKLIAVNAQTYLAASTTGTAHAIALEANTSGTALKKVLKIQPQGAAVAADGNATLTGAEELTNKTVTAAVLKTGFTASGSAANDLSGSTGTFISSTGLNTLSGLANFKAIVTPVAAAGSTVADAGQLGSANIVFITSDGAAKGVKLPETTTIGQVIFVVNNSSTAAELYAESTGTVNGLSADASVVVPASKGLMCISTAAKTWVAFDMTAKATAS